MVIKVGLVNLIRKLVVVIRELLVLWIGMSENRMINVDIDLRVIVLIG